MRDELTSQQVEHWANLIEFRDGILFAPDRDELVLKAIHALANPYLEGALDRTSSSKWLALLE